MKPRLTINIRHLRRRCLASLVLCMALCAMGQTSRWTNPKREFRGAWMHTVYQPQYAAYGTADCKAYLTGQLEKLKEAGVNVVLFQVRPSADAFYSSSYEPWSRFLTKGGKAPSPYWDPLEYMCAEAHRLGMELHAWLNPYRVTTAKNETLPRQHLYYSHPDRFVRYAGDGKIYFDPGVPENRDFIVKVVEDIVARYDIDAIHMDDYFYPYPAGGKDFPDNASYARYGKGRDRAQWRRENVDKLIEGIHEALRGGPKPWVRFGVSPFGIWRNSTTDPRGSATSGLQNYDALYADPLLWARKGWIDYMVPQLYWELDHKRASYTVLVDWWAQAVDPPCHLYIGQDVERCMKAPDSPPSKAANQLDHKIRLTRDAEAISGNCWWPAYRITANDDGAADALSDGAQSTMALVPVYSQIPSAGPAPVKGISIVDGMLEWSAEIYHGDASDQVRFVVYCFPDDVDPDFDDSRYIVDVTSDICYPLRRHGTYFITALDRTNRESLPSPGLSY